jgi:hypothetical protein
MTSRARGGWLFLHATFYEIQPLHEVKVLLLRLFLAVVALGAGGVLLRNPLLVGLLG